MRRTVLLEILSTVFAALFLYTAISKVLEHHNFVTDLAGDPMIGKTAAVYLSIALPIVEFVVATLLFIPQTQKYGLWMSLALMSAFTLYVRWMMHNSHRHCTCGGVLRQMTWRQHLWFNIIFTVLSVIALFIHRSIRRRTTTPDIRSKLA